MATIYLIIEVDAHIYVCATGRKKLHCEVLWDTVAKFLVGLGWMGIILLLKHNYCLNSFCRAF